MIGRIVGWSLRSRGVVVVLAAALLVFGATQLRDMPVDVLPEFTPPRVEVQIEALGLSAARVQFPLEYHAEVLGDQADQRAAERRVLGVTAIAAVLVLLLMQAPFASWRPAAAVFLTLPAALVGGRTARPGPADRRGHRPGPGAAGGAGGHPRPRDRAADGPGCPRQPGHRHPAQPVRHPALYLRFGSTSERRLDAAQ